MPGKTPPWDTIRAVFHRAMRNPVRGRRHGRGFRPQADALAGTGRGIGAGPAVDIRHHQPQPEQPAPQRQAMQQARTRNHAVQSGHRGAAHLKLDQARRNQSAMPRPARAGRQHGTRRSRRRETRRPVGSRCGSAPEPGTRRGASPRLRARGQPLAHPLPTPGVNRDRLAGPLPSKRHARVSPSRCRRARPGAVEPCLGPQRITPFVRSAACCSNDRARHSRRSCTS